MKLTIFNNINWIRNMIRPNIMNLEVIYKIWYSFGWKKLWPNNNVLIQIYCPMYLKPKVEWKKLHHILVISASLGLVSEFCFHLISAKSDATRLCCR